MQGGGPNISKRESPVLELAATDEIVEVSSVDEAGGLPLTFRLSVGLDRIRGQKQRENSLVFF